MWVVLTQAVLSAELKLRVDSACSGCGGWRGRALLLSACRGLGPRVLGQPSSPLPFCEGGAQVSRLLMGNRVFIPLPSSIVLGPVSTEPPPPRERTCRSWEDLTAERETGRTGTPAGDRRVEAMRVSAFCRPLPSQSLSCSRVCTARVPGQLPVRPRVFPGAMAHRGRLQGTRFQRWSPGAPSVCVMLPQLPAPARAALPERQAAPRLGSVWAPRAGLCPRSPTAADRARHFPSALLLCLSGSMKS